MLGLLLGVLVGFGKADVSGDVRREFDDLAGFSIRIEDRVVGCLYPNLAAILANALVAAGQEAAGFQDLPESGVIG